MLGSIQGLKSSCVYILWVYFQINWIWFAENEGGLYQERHNLKKKKKRIKLFFTFIPDQSFPSLLSVSFSLYSSFVTFFTFCLYEMFPFVYDFRNLPFYLFPIQVSRFHPFYIYSPRFVRILIFLVNYWLNFFAFPSFYSLFFYHSIFFLHFFSLSFNLLLFS